MKKVERHEVGTVVGWDETGWVDSWESIEEAWESLEEWATARGLGEDTFTSRLEKDGYLGDDFEPTTIFVYGVDQEATKIYDDLMTEAEAYEAENCED